MGRPRAARWNWRGHLCMYHPIHPFVYMCAFCVCIVSRCVVYSRRLSGAGAGGEGKYPYANGFNTSSGGGGLTEVDVPVHAVVVFI